MSIATLEISSSALLHNVKTLKNYAPTSELMAVIKANAYGHGQIEVATILSGKVNCFGVARLSEAIFLRKAGIQDDIVLLEGLFKHEDPHSLIHYKLSTFVGAVFQIEQLDSLHSASDSISVWFKLDTGMHRLGFRLEEANEMFNRLLTVDVVKKPINISTHFFNGDDPSGKDNKEQIKRCDDFIEQLSTDKVGLVSIAASSGVLNEPKSHRDLIRVGISLYGVSPFALTDFNLNSGHKLGLKSAMTFKSEVIAIRRHKQNETTSYGGVWKSESDTNLGVIAVGYGDGYPRNIKSGTQVLINGKHYSIVGHVCMDMLMVDLGLHNNVHVGDEVILWGSDLPVEQIAGENEMSAYELLTRLTSRSKIIVVK